MEFGGASCVSFYESSQTDTSGGQGTLLGIGVWGVGVGIREKRASCIMLITPPCAHTDVPLSLI